MQNLIRPCVTAQRHIRFLRICQTNIFFRNLHNHSNHIIGKTPASKKISHRHHRWNPDTLTVRQHRNRIFINKITVFDTVHTCFNGSTDAIHSVGMTHNSHPFFMCNVNHLFHFFSFQRCPGHFSMIVEIHQTGGHNFDKICAILFRFQNTLMISFHIMKTFPHNGTVMSFFMNGKNRCAIIDSVNISKFFRTFRHAIRISSIAHKRNSPFLIFFKAPMNNRFLYSLCMHLHSLFIIHTIHDDMGMTFT